MNCAFCQKPLSHLLTDRIRSGPGKVYHCPDCDLGQLEEAGPTDLEAFYSGEYWKNYGPDLTRKVDYEELFHSYVDYQHRRLELLAPVLKPQARLLEVGCATGQFLFHAKDRVAEAVGVDFDPGATEFAAAKTGCRTYGRGLAAAGLEPASFDVVCAFQTLEHVPDPIGFLKELSGYLKPGGKMVIEVPNLYDPLLSVYSNAGYRSFYYHTAHLYYFSPKSLMAACAEAGLDGTIHYVQDYNFTNHMHWVHTGAPQSSCHAGLGPATLPLAVDLPETDRQVVQEWIQQVDLQYKQLLARLGRTENLTFIGGRA